MLSTPEKLVNIALVLLVAGVYGWLTVRRLAAGDGVRAGLRRALELREPSVLLDTSRFVVLLLWAFHLPDIDLLAARLVESTPVDQRTILYRLIDVSSVRPEYLYAGAWLYRASMVLCAIGVLQRTMAVTAAVSYSFLWSTQYAFTHAGHNHIVVMVLLVLSAAPQPAVSPWHYFKAYREGTPAGRAGTYPAYLRYAIWATVVTAYFQSGVEKLIRSGPRWINGFTLQGFLRQMGKAEGLELASSPMVLLVVLSIIALSWELLFPVVLLWPRLRPYGVATALAFHAGVTHLMGPPFVALSIALLLLYSPYEFISLFRRQRIELTRVSTPAFHSRASVIILAVIIALQWAPTALRADHYYPFFNYVMFNGFFHEGQVQPAQGYVYGRTGSTDWNELSAKAVGLSSGDLTEQLAMRYLSTHPRHRRYRALRADYCEQLLRRQRRSSERGPMDELRLVVTYYVAGEEGVHRRVVQSCSLPIEQP